MMLSEEDKKRVEEAKKCDSCLCWLKHCHAECCKIIYINIDPGILTKGGKYIHIKTGKLTSSERLYYRLRGIKIVHGYLRFPKEKCISYGNKVVYVRKCDWLDDNNMCMKHNDKKLKPKLCQELSVDTVRNPSDFEAHKSGDFVVTPNCLFRYKVMGEKDVKEKKQE